MYGRGRIFDWTSIEGDRDGCGRRWRELHGSGRIQQSVQRWSSGSIGFLVHCNIHHQDDGVKNDPLGALQILHSSSTQKRQTEMK